MYSLPHTKSCIRATKDIIVESKKGQEYTVLGQTLPPSQGDKHRDLDDSPGWTNSAILKLIVQTGKLGATTEELKRWQIPQGCAFGEDVPCEQTLISSYTRWMEIAGNSWRLLETKKSWKLLSFDPHFFFVVLWIKLWESFQKIKWKMQVLVVCPITETVVI